MRSTEMSTMWDWDILGLQSKKEGNLPEACTVEEDEELCYSNHAVFSLLAGVIYII